ncbi:hypothetical protein SDC9_112174 [bioreactor metagenome]|uniref:Uncharacterized protein n=1 Tax=bioreactor metagenome TaxID=1076179 RepID=A0A645BII7_9ZZZZ
MQMQQRLCQQLKPFDPHLRGREGMHPRDHANAGVVRRSFAANANNLLGIAHGRLPLDANRIAQRGIQVVGDHLAVHRHLLEGFFSIQILTTGNEIQLLVHAFSSWP